MGIVRSKSCQPIDFGSITPSDASPTRRVEDPTAPQGRRRTLLADHEGLAMNGRNRFFQNELRDLMPGFQRLVVPQQGESRGDLRCSDMHSIPPAMTEWPDRIGGRSDLDRENPRGDEVAGCRELVTSSNLGMMDTPQVDRRPRPSANPGDRTV